MLKEFRSVDVYWDKATRRIYEEIRTSSSDEKGRKLTVQIVNDGQIQDLTNVALNLYWETQDGENRGLDPFTALDPEHGIYELYFRTGMLKHVGKLNAHLHLVDTTGAITSEPFTIFVFEGVDVDAMASEDELSTLTQALVQVNNLETTYAPRLNAVEGSVDSLTDDVALNKSNIVSNTQDIVNLDGRLTTVEQNIKLLQYKSIFNGCTWSETGTYASREVLVIEELRLVYVHLAHGAGSSITETKWIMQLPSEYSPTLTRYIPWVSKSASGTCEVDAEGVIRAYVKSGDSTSFFNINGFIPY